MKVKKWWKYSAKKWTKKELLREKTLWILTWIEVNLCTKKKNRQLRHDLLLANTSYRKMKKYKKWLDKQ